MGSILGAVLSILLIFYNVATDEPVAQCGELVNGFDGCGLREVVRGTNIIGQFLK